MVRVGRMLTACLLLATLTLGLNCSRSRQLVGAWQYSGGGCGSMTIVFNSDGTGSAQTFAGTQPFQWEVKGDRLLLSGSDIIPKNDRGYRFEIKGSQLWIYGEGSPMNQTLVLTRVGK